MHDDVFNCVGCKKDTSAAEAHDLIITYCVSCTSELRKRPEPLGEAVCFSCWMEIKCKVNPVQAVGAQLKQRTGDER